MLMNQWESRWQDGHIGFHLQEVNPILVRYSDWLAKRIKYWGLN